MPLSRRDLMKMVGAAGVTACFSDAFADTTPIDKDRQFLLLNFSGGWDQTLCFDPRDPDVFTDARKLETGIELAWGDLQGPFRNVGRVRPTGSNIDFGPAIGSLAAWYRKMCVVRGMSMDTLSHQVGTRYFLTGKQPAGPNARGSSVGANVVDQLVAADPTALRQIPNLVLDTEAYYEGTRSEPRPFRASAESTYTLTAAFTRNLATTYSNLVLGTLEAARPGSRAPGHSTSANLLTRHRSQPLCDPLGFDARGVMTSVREGQARNEKMFASQLATKFDLTNPANTANVVRYGAYLPGTPGAAAFIARQALLERVSNCVTVQLQKDLDTHASSHAQLHPMRLNEGFEKVALLLGDLEATPHPAGGNFLDHVTVLLFSEFTRTALLNPARGRDHALTNCCALFGAGVPHNRVIGASSDFGMQPQAVRRSDGVVATSDPNAVVIHPEHVIASMLGSAGYDTTSLREIPLPCLMQAA